MDYIFAFVVGCILVWAGVYMIWMAFQMYKLQKLIRDTPTSKIRSMPTGIVEIKGKAESGDEQLKSPLDGKPCLFYNFEIERWDKDPDENKREWSKIKTKTESCNFYLDDGTGKVVIEPDEHMKYDISMAKGSQWKTRSPEEKEPLREFIERQDDISNHYIKRNSRVANRKRYRFTQKVIKEGDELYVFGSAYRLKAAADDEHADMKITSGKRDFFYISDMEEEKILQRSAKKPLILFIMGTFILALTGILFYKVFTGTL